MIEGVTKCGFAFSLDDEALNDMELFEALCDLDRGDMSAVAEVCRRLLGERKKDLYERLRTNGRVPIDKVVEALGEILQAGKTAKKS